MLMLNKYGLEFVHNLVIPLGQFTKYFIHFLLALPLRGPTGKATIESETLENVKEGSNLNLIKQAKEKKL
jgi:hypothetical protein